MPYICSIASNCYGVFCSVHPTHFSHLWWTKAICLQIPTVTSSSELHMFLHVHLCYWLFEHSITSFLSYAILVGLQECVLVIRNWDCTCLHMLVSLWASTFWIASFIIVSVVWVCPTSLQWELLSSFFFSCVLWILYQSMFRLRFYKYPLQAKLFFFFPHGHSFPMRLKNLNCLHSEPVPVNHPAFSWLETADTVTSQLQSGSDTWTLSQVFGMLPSGFTVIASKITSSPSAPCLTTVTWKVTGTQWGSGGGGPDMERGRSIGKGRQRAKPAGKSGGE
jgi:hypothetical protein